MMRSAANAIACRPDEQNRLIVTAEASTGMPARKLAMRATFNPCSASGIAHPRITSSISRGSMPGARRSASAITAAPRSSGRVPRSVPLGALPTAVRTADTITASFIPVSQQIFDSVGELAHLPVEQVIGAVDDGELFWIRRSRIELAHLFQRAELVEFALNEELRLRALPHCCEVVTRQRRGDPDERGDARILRAHGQRNPGAERHPAAPLMRLRIPAGHEVDCRAAVGHFTRTVAVGAGARPRAPKVEAQDRAAGAAQCLRGVIDRLRVHRPPVLRMWMREDNR